MPKYYLFSNIRTCQHCRMLVDNLEKSFPQWTKHVKYISAGKPLSSKDRELAMKLGVLSLPCFTTDEQILFKGYSLDTVKNIIKLCTTETTV